MVLRFVFELDEIGRLLWFPLSHDPSNHIDKHTLFYLKTNKLAIVGSVRVVLR